jgi:F-type H+-transporting ATPase subunit b
MGMREMLLVPALVVGLAAAAPALSQEAPPARGTAVAPAPEGEAPPAEAAVEAMEALPEAPEAPGERAGMPQLDTATYSSQIFWLILTFATLFWLLRRKALPRVAEILEIRQDRIAADLDRAATLRAEAEEVLRRYEALVAAARAKGADQVRATQERLVAEAAARRVPLEQELQRKLAEAEQRIATAKRKALDEIQAAAAEVAQAAVDRLAGLAVSPADARKALDAVLREAA